MKPVTRWELIKTIAEAYERHYLGNDPTEGEVSIIFNRYGLDSTLRGKYELLAGEYLVLRMNPGDFGDNVETIDDIYTWFIDYALRDIDDWINDLEEAIEADKTAKKADMPA